MDFRNKVVWITGASSGIGEHLAYALSEQEAKLVISARNERELQRVKDNCQNNTDIMVLPLDVTNHEAITAAVVKVVAHFSNIDVLINNAGVSQRALIKDTQFEVDERIMAINYLGTVAMTKAVLPVMLEQGHGHIAVMSSVMGKISVPYRSAYAASKHALHGYFDALRAEMQDENIKVTVFCPGYVRTNVTINALTGDGSKHNMMTPQSKKGMDPAVFARKALRAIAKGKEEAYFGGMELTAVYVKRFFPRLFSWVIKRVDFKPRGVRQ